MSSNWNNGMIIDDFAAIAKECKRIAEQTATAKKSQPVEEPEMEEDDDRSLGYDDCGICWK
jgi:hypothetical protein